jgi:hypothetical protein
MSFSDALTSCCALISGVSFLVFPVYAILMMNKYQKVLDWPICQAAYGALYEDLRTDCWISSRYHVLFILRRLVIALLLVMTEFGFLQVMSFVVLSLVNCIILAVYRPFIDKQ